MIYVYRVMVEKGFTPITYFDMVSEQNSCLKIYEFISAEILNKSLDK